ncbi:MAG: HAMP domain-containing histidine kinase [Ardenticatenales bacterium]|nr:HAMP domain-containing histidine kinase [Ardenticatenales bacterium]
MSNDLDPQHLSRGFIAERRADSLTMLLPIVVSAMTLTGIIVAALTFRDDWTKYWSLWLGVVASPVSAALSWRYLGRERQYLAAHLFLYTHLALFTLIMMQFWEAGAFLYLPFAYGVFIVISGMMLNVRAGLITWVWSALLPLAGLLLSDRLNLPNMGRLLPATFINFLLAGLSYLAVYDWELALASVSVLQQRAQQRRDELFHAQQALSASNARLQFLNTELDKARTLAEEERDTRTRFMNNLSHELRTPLNAIVNFANILARGGTGPLNNRQVDYLERVERSGWHLLGVLNDLLDMAQIEAGEFKIHLEPTDLHAICEEAMQNIQGLILDRPIELRRDYPPEWPTIQADPMRLKQALLNVLGNAAKYTEMGFIGLQVLVAADEVRLIVTDSGIGIDPADHERIFEEFQQLDQTTARKRTGTGLGLPLSRHLIQQHGGSIIVESALGKGSRFILALPIANPAPEPLPAS